MKVFYQCERCGKKFTTENEAKICESKHEEERIKAEALKKEKKSRALEIEVLLQKYIDDYHETPVLKVSGSFRGSIPEFLFNL